MSRLMIGWPRLRHARSAAILVSLTLGCGGAGEYVCPDPVGRIIRDDCDAYRTKYETLKVELGASVGPLNAKISLGKSSLRDPSELLQIMAHRTHALCKDFNACRVPAIEYRQRREQADHVFTAVSTIQTQLKESLDAANKARLVQELVRILSEDRFTPSGGSSAAGGRGPAVRSGRRWFTSWVPWYGTKLLPPQPKGVAGFPALVSARFTLSHRRKTEAEEAYAPHGTFNLRGEAFSADDVLTIDWGGQTSDCPIARSRQNDLASANCEAPKELALTGAAFTVRVTFRRGSDGKAAVIGAVTTAVASRVEKGHGYKPGSRRYAINYDELLGRGQLLFLPQPGALPPDFEQPNLEVVVKTRKFQRATARCWVNGQVATPGLEERGGGQVGTFQDRERYEKTGPGSSRAVAAPFVEWWRKRFPLPFLVPRERSTMPPQVKAWPVVGNWRCAVSIEGEPVRELRFTVERDGRLGPHPRQLERPSAAWLVETRVLKTSFEALP